MLFWRAFEGGVLKNLIKPVFSELFAIFDKTTRGCRLDEDSTSMDNQLSQYFIAWLLRSKSPLLPNYFQMVFQENRDIIVDNCRLYVVEYKVLVVIL
jgi:hypothetical protein